MNYAANPAAQAGRHKSVPPLGPTLGVEMSASAKERFLSDELFSMTLAATVQRSSVYRESAAEEGRVAFRRGLQNSLVRLAEQYHEPVPDAVHCKNIEALAEELSAKHGDVLVNGRFRIGSAQKALNLYLKYRWCLGRVAMPPHCPIDAVILARVHGCGDVRWTRLDSITQYEEVIRKAKAVAGKSPLAEWELQLYNAVQPGSETDASR